MTSEKRDDPTMSVMTELRSPARESASGATTGERRRSARRATRWVLAAALLLGLPLIGGLVGYSMGSSASPTYVSQAVVVATDTTIPAGDFAEVALAVFSTDEVLDGVVQDLSLQQTPAELLRSKALSAEAVANTVAVRIQAQAPDRALAQAMANSAAASFIKAVEGHGLATLKSFQASRPTTAQAPPRKLYALLGAAGGLAVALVALWVAWLLTRQREGVDDSELYSNEPV